MDGLMPIHLLSAVLIGKGSLSTQVVLSKKLFHNYDKLHWLVVRTGGKFMLLWLQYVCTKQVYVVECHIILNISMNV